MDSRNANALARPRHEPIETDVRAVWRTGAAIVGVVVAALLLIAGMMNWLEDVEGDPGPEKAASTDLNWAGRNRLEQLRDQEQQWLNGHAWVDRNAEVARVPIHRAIEIISQNGLPAALTAPAVADRASVIRPESQVNPSTGNEGAKP